MELIAGDVEALHRGIADFDALFIAACIERAFDLEPGVGGGCADQLDHGKTIRERWFPGFMAISLEDQTTTFPKDVDPRLYIFGGYRLQMGDVQLLRSPLDVLMASEHGITNCIAFLTEKISVEQLFYLSKFLEDRKLESIILM